MKEMRAKKFIFKYAGIPGEPSGFEGPMLYTAAIVALTMGSVVSIFTNPETGFRTPLLPVALFFLMKFFISGEGDWVIYAPVKIGVASLIYLVGMPLIHNGWWFVWAGVAVLFSISGLIDLIACVYEWSDKRNGKKTSF